jgi:hypothetical protein
MRSNFTGPVNIGSGEMVTIDRLVDLRQVIAFLRNKGVDGRHFFLADP